MKTINDLTNHIKKHNDAVIIVGPGINPIESDYSVDDFNKNYTRKTLVRNPFTAWKFYFDNLQVKLNNSKAYELIEQINSSLVLDQNTNGSISAAYLHGHVNLFKCQKCKVVYPSAGVDISITETEVNADCELCGGILRPTILLSGERYDQILFDDFKSKLLNTHTLILIGMDYTEESLLNLIADYGDMKSQLNADGNPENERALIAIQSDEEEFDPNELAFCEFLVKGDITDSLKRLVDVL